MKRRILTFVVGAVILFSLTLTGCGGSGSTGGSSSPSGGGSGGGGGDTPSGNVSGSAQ